MRKLLVVGLENERVLDVRMMGARGLFGLKGEEGEARAAGGTHGRDWIEGILYPTLD